MANEDEKKPKGPSDFFLNVNEEKFNMRKAFLDKQKDQLAKIGQKKGKPKEAVKLWTGLTVDHLAKRETFNFLQKVEREFERNRKPGGTSKKWYAISEDQKAVRDKFIDNQKTQRGPLARGLNKAKDHAALLKGKAETTSSQWKTNVVYNYHVTIPGIALMVGDFRRISGLGTDERVIESYHEGGDNGAEHYLIGHQRANKIVMEWAIRHPDPFMIWWVLTGTGVMIKEPIIISLLDHNRVPRAIWSLPFAMATKIEFPELDAMSSEVATNKIELIHNGLIPIPC